MADFKALATDFVLSETGTEQRDIIARAAHAIQSAVSRTSAVSHWAQSIGRWMPDSSREGDAQPDDGQDRDDDDVVARAKALSFLAGTLGELDKGFLHGNQVDQLAVFFGRMFSLDHKAGVMPAALALRHLVGMEQFSPRRSSGILGDICQLGDDFHRQVPSTRWEIYLLLDFLLSDAGVREHLREQNGRPEALMASFLQLCRHERDPKNLTVWFRVIRLFLLEYAETVVGAEDVFRTYSAYFPVSMRSSTAPSGITVDDLKSALRGCFSASHLAAGKVLSFLLEKLDQGDAVSVSVKIDILRTLWACTDSFPASAVAPHAAQMWNSLKYEVRNGEVEDVISGTLDVIRLMSTRLSPPPTYNPGGAFLEDFLGMSMADCLGDLSDSVYARHVGSLLTNLAAGSVEAFNRVAPHLLGALKSNIGRSTLPLHTRDLISILNDVLRVRRGLLSEVGATQGDLELTKLLAHDATVANLLEEIYLPLWRQTAATSLGPTQIDVLREIMKGLAELLHQRVPTSGVGSAMLCSAEQGIAILRLLLPCVIWPFHSPAPYPPHAFRELAGSAMLALEEAITAYPPGFRLLADEVAPSILGRRVEAPGDAPSELPGSPQTGQELWATPRPQDLVMLKEMLSRLATIGFSSLQQPDMEAVKRLKALTSTLLGVLRVLLREPPLFQVSMVVLSGIQGAMLNFREACLSAGLITSGGKQRPVVKSTSGPVVPETRHPATKKPSLAAESGDGAGLGTQPRDLGEQQVVGEYLGTCLQTAAELYRWSTTEGNGALEVGPVVLATDAQARGLPTDLGCSHDGLSSSNAIAAAAFLYQVAGVAAFVLRDLTIAEQQSLAIHQEPSRLFRLTNHRSAMFHNDRGGQLDVLSMGIYRGLHPPSVTSMLELGLAPVNVFDDFDHMDYLTDRSLLARDSIASLVANKYAPGEPGTPGRKRWEDAIGFVKTRLLEEDTQNLKPAQFSRIVAFMAGALARLDPAAKIVAELLVLALSRSRNGREEMARCIGHLLLDNGNLDPENLAIVKPLYRQWVYAHITQPLTTVAQRVGSDDHDAKICAIALLPLLRHTSFTIYEQDAEVLTRILITAISRLEDWREKAMAFQLLTIMVESKAEAPKGHISTVVDSARKVFSLATTAGNQQEGNARHAAACRHQIVRLLSRLPASYEQQYLLHLSPSVTRMLSTACGDSMRQVREAAQSARENWATV